MSSITLCDLALVKSFSLNILVVVRRWRYLIGKAF